LSKIVELQTEHGRTSLVLKLRRTDKNSETERRIEQLRRLCEDVSHHDKEQTEKLLPILQQRMTQATQTLTDCIELKDIATDWWEQPAQLCTPWITVDGLNLQQWRDKFTVTATQLRQLPEPKQ
jgi:HAUS augmin-like complex subunit 5